MRKRTIVLASASPRREEILRDAGLQFIVDPGDFEEDLTQKMAPHALARFMSRKKAEAVAHQYENALVIAADTFIVFGKVLLGKPHTPTEAKRMLSLLSGKKHSVITGFTVIDTASNERVSKAVETKVYFKKLTPEEINAYVHTGEPLDKAGAYAIQGLGALLVKKIEGDYLNVVGLPLSALGEVLMKFGISLL